MLWTAKRLLCVQCYVPRVRDKKIQKEVKPFPILLPSMPKAGWRIIFVFPTNAEEHNYTESFSLNKKCLMYKTNTEMLLVLIMLSLTSFYVSIYSSRHS